MGEERKQGSGDKKLTKVQLEILERLTTGDTIHYTMGIRTEGKYRIRKNIPGTTNLGERLRRDVIDRLLQLGALKLISDPAWRWRNADYTISDKGRELVRLTNGNPGSDGL